MTIKTKYALSKCKQQGIKIFVATARPPMLKKTLGLSLEDDILLNDGGVFYNGGCINCEGKKEYISIPQIAVKNTISIISKYDEVNLAVQMVDEFHGFRYHLSEEEHRLWGTPKSELIPYNEIIKYETVKMVIFSSSLVFNPFDLPEELYSELTNSLGCYMDICLTDKGKAIQAVSNNTSKKKAIDRICNICGLQSNEVAVFGDDFNDIEMLSSFEYSFAMGNACDEIKMIANYITRSNNEEGIHYALKDILALI